MNELVIERVFDAPVSKVWQAWSDPEIFMKWWGPKPFTAPFIKINFRPGGKYLWCMRDRKGRDYWNTGTYLKIVPMRRIVYTDKFSDKDGNAVPASTYGLSGEWADETKVTVTFEDLDDKTKMTIRHAGPPAGEMTKLTRAGWDTSLDKLAENL
jgi:uncharacterized protein YndB with AHSA1/START domain